MHHLTNQHNEFGLPSLTRRTMLQAGTVSLLGLGTNHLHALNESTLAEGSAKSIIYIFLSGGLGQQDSFDMKPEAPDNIRGEFLPISTATPGVHICEHLPQLAKRSQYWSLVRSLTHPYNEHSEGHHVMLTGRTMKPPSFQASKPMPDDWPSIASIVGDQLPSSNNLPPAVVLPNNSNIAQAVSSQGNLQVRWVPKETHGLLTPVLITPSLMEHFQSMSFTTLGEKKITPN